MPWLARKQQSLGWNEESIVFIVLVLICCLQTSWHMIRHRLKGQKPNSAISEQHSQASAAFTLSRCGAWTTASANFLLMQAGNRGKAAMFSANPVLLGARTLLGAPGLTTRNKKLLGAPGIATRSKDATRSKGHRY